MNSPEKKEVKDVYSSMHLDTMRRKESEDLDNKHPSFNDFHEVKNEGEVHDLHVKLGNDFLEQKEKMKSTNVNVQIDKSPLSNLLHPGGSDSKAAKSKTSDPDCDKANKKKGPGYYHEVETSAKIMFKKMHRLVHLDLKGAPPKMKYLLEIIPMISKLGATGLLIEYEDMFPYSGLLKEVPAANAYSLQQIGDILSLAHQYNLLVIPIIQTFGHMEFVLKALNFKDVRESDYTPQVINVASQRSYDIIRSMVKQVGYWVLFQSWKSYHLFSLYAMEIKWRSISLHSVGLFCFFFACLFLFCFLEVGGRGC